MRDECKTGSGAYAGEETGVPISLRIPQYIPAADSIDATHGVLHSSFEMSMQGRAVPQGSWSSNIHSRE
ncbi:MAG: hypothetical protein CW742_05730 [Methanoregula sp.]|nr:MAG: hypothetical protein CW742_05730 [Methanoregula sp.]